MKTDQVRALLNPKSIAILGARERPSGWTARIFAALQRFEFPGPVWPVNPNRDEIWGVPCYPDLGSLPGTPDHLVVMLRAEVVMDTLREGARRGARSATLYATGFGEAGTIEGRAREAALGAVIAETGLAVSGPNCLGNMSAAARFLSLPEDRLRALVPGPVAMVGQSGTTTPAIGRALIDRGIDVGYIVTSGNEVGLTVADYISYFITDPEIRVIFCLIEAVRDTPSFLAACNAAREAGKPVVAIKMGGSEGAREAALAHTGSLAGTLEAFDAVAGEAGVIRAEGTDHAIDVIEFLVHAPAPPPLPGMGVLVYSGGVRGLALEAGTRYGVVIPKFSPETATRIGGIFGDGTKVTNPLDATGFLTRDREVLLDLVAAMMADDGIGMVLLQEDLPPTEGLNDANRRRAQRVIHAMEGIEERFLAQAAKPLALISATSYDLTEYARTARRRFPHIPVLGEPARVFRAIRSVLDYHARAQLPPPGEGGGHGGADTATGPVARQLRDMAANVGDGQIPVSEILSKALLAEYGIRTPDEELTGSADEAVAAARRIGYPVVLKGVTAQLTHKSDAGAVALGLADDDAVRRAYDGIIANVAAYDPEIALDGVLAARAVVGGLELVIGINRDPEMGPVVMFGMGGVWLELFKDVAFAPPGLDRARAERRIADTRAAARIAGYRGAPPHDHAAIVDALLAAGRIARDLGDVIVSLDINPFSVLGEGEGGFALDALVVLRGGG